MPKFRFRLCEFCIFSVPTSSKIYFFKKHYGHNLHVVRVYGKNLAPGEARTPDLRISLSVLTYKYDALTDCATGAMGHCRFRHLSPLQGFKVRLPFFETQKKLN